MKLAAAAKPAVIAILALALFVPVNMMQGLVLAGSPVLPRIWRC